MPDICHSPEAFMAQHYGPRTYRPQRQRVPKNKDKIPVTRLVGEIMPEGSGTAEHTDGLLNRTSLCLPRYGSDSVIHGGEPGFKDVLRKYFPTPESNATERLVVLKAKLRAASTEDFWKFLMEDMTDIMGSQCAFVAKRILVDEENSAVEMPEYGEPGSCLMGVAFYLNNGIDTPAYHRDYRYTAYGTPCEHMRHDKVFIVPENMMEFVPNNPNAHTFPWGISESFIGLPLFIDGKCFAHFGMIWSAEGATRRTLSWTFIELFMHSLEDIINQRIIEGRGFAKEAAPPDSTTAKVIPLTAISASQTLKPWARCLSHELRTPMQGVVGMLDIMYSTVLEAINNQASEEVREVFKDLKNHIEVVQDSSKRAVEAADNVVYAYDHDMQMPETPLTPGDPDLSPHGAALRTNSGLLSPRSRKHERSQDAEFGPPLKRPFGALTSHQASHSHSAEDTSRMRTMGATMIFTENTAPVPVPGLEVDSTLSETSSTSLLTPPHLSTTPRRIVTREFIGSVVADSIQIEHPISEQRHETVLGDAIEFKSVGPRGESRDRIIHLNIEPNVPEAIYILEDHFHFSVKKLVDNAIKFTKSGSITITARLGTDQMLEIWVHDTGCGISEESQQRLFQRHYQADSSMVRAHDGLGLSLYNTKYRVRKFLGGDVTLERSATGGPNKGTEFLIRLPFNVGGSGLTPIVGTPTPGGGLSASRPGSYLEATKSSGYFLPPPTSAPLPTSRPASPFKPSRPKAQLNRELATEYPLNILIAEDNAINRSVAIGSLNKLGYVQDNITLAFDGLEAVEKFKESLEGPVEKRFDAVLMDLWMPNMDGYEASENIIKMITSNNLQTKIIAVTADITVECQDKVKEVGMQGFLAKPYKVLDMECLILEHFSHMKAQVKDEDQKTKLLE